MAVMRADKPLASLDLFTLRARCKFLGIRRGVYRRGSKGQDQGSSQPWRVNKWHTVRFTPLCAFSRIVHSCHLTPHRCSGESGHRGGFGGRGGGFRGGGGGRGAPRGGGRGGGRGASPKVLLFVSWILLAI